MKNTGFSYEYSTGDLGGTGLAIFAIVILIFLVIGIILLVRLSKSMSAAAEDNARINQMLAAVPEEKIGVVNALYNNAKKELGMALLLVFILGSFGVHKIYLGEKKAAILFMIFAFTCIPAIISFFDAMKMPKTISEYNLNIITSLSNQLVDR
ncbi:MAG: TM2 domain-containing protein [Flexilinea sp.]|jgi:TM2 domain-containing membrane protein YozV